MLEAFAEDGLASDLEAGGDGAEGNSFCSQFTAGQLGTSMVGVVVDGDGGSEPRTDGLGDACPLPAWQVRACTTRLRSDANSTTGPANRLGWHTPAEALDQLLSDQDDPPGVALIG